MTQALRIVEKKQDPATLMRTVIDITDQDIDRHTAEIILALIDANEDGNYYFSLGSLRVIASISPEGWQLQNITPDRIAPHIGRFCQFVRSTKKGGGQYLEVKPQYPSAQLVKNTVNHPDFPEVLKPLDGISPSPVYGSDWELFQDNGYSEKLRRIVEYDGQAVKPKTNPSADDVGEAIGLIWDLICDFPFKDTADIANTFAAIILPFVRPAINSPTPLIMIEASTPGTGKTLLADVVLILGYGSRYKTVPPGRDPEEQKKRLTALISASVPAVLIDNAEGAEGGDLAMTVTSRDYTDRILGRTETFTVKNETVFFSTSNNPTFSTELARRTLPIRMESPTERPWERSGFTHADLRGYVRNNRARLITAVCTLVENWKSKGCPDGSRIMGSFESFSAIIGGILEAAGNEDFGGNLEAMMSEADQEGEAWRALVSAWWEAFATNPVRAAEVYELAAEVEGIFLGKGTEHAQRMTLAKQLGKQRGRIHGGCKIVLHSSDRVKLWKLERIG